MKDYRNTPTIFPVWRCDFNWFWITKPHTTRSFYGFYGTINVLVEWVSTKAYDPIIWFVRKKNQFGAEDSCNHSVIVLDSRRGRTDDKDRVFNDSLQGEHLNCIKKDIQNLSGSRKFLPQEEGPAHHLQDCTVDWTNMFKQFSWLSEELFTKELP